MRLRVLYIIVLLLASGMLHAQGPATDSLAAPARSTDTTTTAKSKEKKQPSIHQLRLGLDLFGLATSLIYETRKGYEVQADYMLSQKTYLVAEAGLGKGKVNYSNLKYDNNGYFFRAGVDQQFLDIISVRDFDIGFIGVRYGIGFGNRSEASYTVASPFGPPTEGTIPSQQFIVHWGEITAGVKVELGRRIFAGWNVRGKFLLNGGVFKDLSPNYIPGYGKGDKSTTFDFNFYLSYALRWGRS